MAPSKIRTNALPPNSFATATSVPLKKKRLEESTTAQALHRPGSSTGRTDLGRSPNLRKKDWFGGTPPPIKNAMNWVPDSSPKQQIKPIQNMQNQEAIQRVSPRDAEPKPNQDKENDKIKLEKGLRSLTATFGAFTGAALMADYGGRFGGGKGFAAGAVIGLLGGHVAGDQLGWGLAKVGEGAAKTHEWLKSNKNHTRSIFDLW